MAPTEGRVAMPEWRWDCRHGTPADHTDLCAIRTHSNSWWSCFPTRCHL